MKEAAEMFLFLRPEGLGLICPRSPEMSFSNPLNPYSVDAVGNL